MATTAQHLPLKDLMNKLGLTKVHGKVRETPNKKSKHLVFWDAAGEKVFIHFSKPSQSLVATGQDTKGMSSKFNAIIFEKDSKTITMITRIGEQLDANTYDASEF